MNSFIEKLILLLIGSFLTYYFSFKLMNHYVNESENVDVSVIKNIEEQCNMKLNLNKYECMLANDVILKDKLNSKLEDIAGYENVKENLAKLIITPFNNDSKFVQKGIIFYGPPGTGKTLFARCLANSLDSIFINFSVSSIENKMYGESSKLLKALFTFAEKLESCTIFIDELDGFASHRNSMDQHHTTSLKTQFLTHVDGVLEKKSKLLLVGATNQLNNIDKAVKRRMFLHIKIDLPCSQDIKKIVQLYFDKYDIDYTDVILDNITNVCNGLNCSDINEIIRIMCLRNETMGNSEEKFTSCLEFLKTHKNMS